MMAKRITIDKLKEQAAEQSVAKIIERLCCPICETPYDSDYEAEDCCKDSWPTQYSCSICDAHFPFEDEALEHIKKPHGTSEPLTTDDLRIDRLHKGQTWYETEREIQRLDAITLEHREAREIIGI